MGVVCGGDGDSRDGVVGDGVCGDPRAAGARKSALCHADRAVFLAAGLGALGTGALVVGVLSGWLLLRIGILLPAMVVALTVALVVGGVLWHAVGKRG